MTSDSEFYIKLFVTFLAAGTVTYIMDILHRRKVREADRQFKLTMKAYGLSETVIEKTKGDSSGNDSEKR